jgi:calcineurin-like phosphoesterase family protein
MARFFTSDEHYGHRNILKFCKRPFADIYEMREALIAAHNAKVGRGDITFHNGDMFWRTMSVSEAMDILNQLNGQHILVWGNHDELIENNRDLQGRFARIGDIIHLQKNDVVPKMVLCHYAMRVWRNSHHGSYHLYGHSRAALPEANTLSFDCGVDTRPDYAPWSEAEIVSKMKAKKAAGAMDEMEKEIKDNPWDKSEGAEVLYPSPQTTLHVGDITTTAHSGIVAKHAEGAWSNGHLHKR